MCTAIRLGHCRRPVGFQGAFQCRHVGFLGWASFTIRSFDLSPKLSGGVRVQDDRGDARPSIMVVAGSGGPGNKGPRRRLLIPELLGSLVPSGASVSFSAAADVAVLCSLAIFLLLWYPTSGSWFSSSSLRLENS